MAEPSSNRGVVLALDVGAQRVGVAATDALGLMAVPLRTLTASPRREMIEQVVRLVAERGAVQVVVGLPLDADGRSGRQARAVQPVIDQLRDRLAVDVVVWDERMSTRHAARGLDATNVRGARRRAVIDAAAACLILQSYLDAQRGDDGRGRDA